jgi:hypothetical protein
MLTKPVTADKFKHCLDLTNVFSARKERKGEEAATPNLSVPSGGPILDYFQRGKYSLRWKLLKQVAHILLKAHWV